MEFGMTPELKQIQRVSRELAVGFAKRAAEHDRDASTPFENYEAIRKAGLFGLVIPKEYGGMGMGMLGYVISAEELAQGCPSTALSFNMHSAVLAALLMTGPLLQETKKKISDLVVREGKLISATFSEPQFTGLIPSSYACATTTRRVDGGVIVNGKKSFATMVEAADLHFLVAHPEESSNPQETLCAIIPAKLPGMQIDRMWDTLGMRATRSDNVIFENCFVADQYILHDLPVPSLGGWLVNNEHYFNLPYTAVYFGVGVAALNAAKETAWRRKPVGFAQPLAYHPDVRRRIALASAQLDSARLMIYHSAYLMDTEGHNDRTLSTYMKAKYLVGESVAGIIRSALEIGGGHALVKGGPLERLYRDGASATIHHPPSDYCLSEIARLDLGLDPKELQPPVRMA